MRLFIIIMVELKSRNLHSENMALQGLSTVSVAVTISVRPSTSKLVRIPSSSLCQVPSPRIRIGSVRCKAVGENQQQVYNGVYGPWTVEAEDVKEVPPSPHSFNLCSLVKLLAYCLPLFMISYPVLVLKDQIGQVIRISFCFVNSFVT